MGRTRTKVAAAVVLAGALALSACGGGGASGGGGADANSLVIGFMGDLTGESSGIVIPPRNGAKLAIDAYNATNPPKKIVLKEYDSQGNPDQAVPLVTQAIQQDKIVALIGPAFSGESKVADPVLEDGQVPNISPGATSPGLAQAGYKYFHRVVAPDSAQGPAVAEFLVRTTSPRKAYVISDDQEYSVGIADAVSQALTAAGVTVGRDQFAKDASDYSSTVAKVRGENPDMVFYGGYYAQAGRLLKQLRDSGVTATFATGDGSFDPGLVAGAGPAAAEGTVISCPCAVPGANSTSGRLTQFYEQYRARSNADLAVDSAEGYDAATAFIAGVKAGHTTGPEINTFLSSLRFEGVAKPVKFRPDGNVEAGDIYVYQVRGGVPRLLGNTKEAKLG